MLAGSSDKMSFFGRFSNFFSYMLMDFMMGQIMPGIEAVMKENVPDLPPITVSVLVLS